MKLVKHKIWLAPGYTALAEKDIDYMNSILGLIKATIAREVVTRNEDIYEKQREHRS